MGMDKTSQGSLLQQNYCLQKATMGNPRLSSFSWPWEVLRVTTPLAATASILAISGSHTYKVHGSSENS